MTIVDSVAKTQTADTSISQEAAKRRLESRFSRPTPKNRVTLQTHGVQTGEVLVSLQIWSQRERPKGVKLEVHRDDGSHVETMELVDSDWSNLGGKVFGKWARSTWIAEKIFRHLMGGSEAYVVFALREDRVIASSSFEPFPLIFPDSSEAPFTVFAGSCADIERHGYKNKTAVQGDIETFRSAVENAARSPEALSPDLAIFMGDQVYLDQPVKYWRTRNSMRWLWNTFLRKYERSWLALDKVMADSQTICLTDDHEYWNDYPNAPVRFGWPALRNPRYRKDVRRLAEACADSIQQTSPYRTLVSYKGVNFIFLETRRWRGLRSGRLCPDEALNQTVRDLRRARIPTVLVVGQPIFSGATSTRLFGTVLGDRLLPSHRRQFTQLAEAINQSPHDVVVLAGDAHYSRLAKASMPANEGRRSEHQVIEVVSSPLLGLERAPARFIIGEDGQGDVWPHESIRSNRRSRISYLASSSVDPSSNDASVNNAVYLKFNRGTEEDTIKMQVVSVDLDGQARSSKALKVDFRDEFVLR